mgnify:CR=1 FL=1
MKVTHNFLEELHHNFAKLHYGSYREKSSDSPLAGPGDHVTTVEWRTKSGTALAGEDYIAAADTVSSAGFGGVHFVLCAVLC